MTAQTARNAPSKRLVRTLNKALADGCSWTELETIAIDKAMAAEDRAAALQRLLDAELAKPLPSSRKATELAAEIRQLEATVVKLVGMLAPDPDVSAAPKSLPHQRSARARWDRRSHRSVA